jgi:hypothetical protein
MIAVQDVQEMQNQVTGIHYRMLDSLRNGDVSGAMDYVTETMKNKYENAFNALSPAELSSYIDTIGVVEGGRFFGEAAEIIIIRQDGGNLTAFPVFVVREPDGIWRVGGM